MTESTAGNRRAARGGSVTRVDLNAPVQYLKGVGAVMAGRLQRLQIHTIGDLLFHLPLRYQDRTRIVPLGALRPGLQAVIEAEILHSEIRYARRRMLLSRLADGTGFLTLRFFNFSEKQKIGLETGAWLRCFGEIRGTAGNLEMIHPEYQRIERPGVGPAADPHLTPLYPATEGVGQSTLRGLIERVLAVLDGAGTTAALPELVPAAVLNAHAFPDLPSALRFLHRPPADTPLAPLEQGRHPAQRRLAFEELLAHQLSFRRLREEVQREAAPPLGSDGDLLRRFIATLPFGLTAAQRRVIAEIEADCARDFPMQRLVQGDVGCGKTVVAAAALLMAVAAGRQGAVMVPTEILSEQHYRNFEQWFAPLGLKVGWLSGKMAARQKDAALAAIASAEVDVVVGTHALIQDGVTFARLGLVIVDEQHRFGVHQRLAFRDKGSSAAGSPHQLIMTATPIPRTLVMTAYADLDTSVIDELPPGRQAIETVIVSAARRDQVLERVYHACRAGRQVYWVCTLIEESESLQCQAAIDTAVRLQQELTDVEVGLIHGRMRPAEKEAVMEQFKSGALGLLVATTVIEVGVDVANASLMIIEDADRLGLAQLHQLRGRVGRGSDKSACVLMYQGPLSARGRQRLAVLRDSNDGFEIARRDLELRGPGEILGTQQAGIVQYRIADLLRDQDLIAAAGKAAEFMLKDCPARADGLIRRWLGEGVRCGRV